MNESLPETPREGAALAVRARSTMNVPEFCRRLGISNCLGYKLIQQGQVPHSRIGARGRRGKIVISEDDLRHYLESVHVARRDPPASPPVVLRHLSLNDAPRGDSRG